MCGVNVVLGAYVVATQEMVLVLQLEHFMYIPSLGGGN